MQAIQRGSLLEGSLDHLFRWLLRWFSVDPALIGNRVTSEKLWQSQDRTHTFWPVLNDLLNPSNSNGFESIPVTVTPALKINFWRMVASSLKLIRLSMKSLSPAENRVPLVSTLPLTVTSFSKVIFGISLFANLVLTFFRTKSSTSTPSMTPSTLRRSLTLIPLLRVQVPEIVWDLSLEPEFRVVADILRIYEHIRTLNLVGKQPLTRTGLN